MVVNTSDSFDFNSTPEKQFKFDDPLQRIILGSLFIPICLIGLFGNSLVILSVLASRKLHTVSNVFVVNLSVADLLVCLCLPVTIAQLFYPLGEQVGPDWVCFLNAGAIFACIGVSVLTLASISLTRALIVTRPLAVRFPRWMMAWWITLIWLLPFSVGVSSQFLWAEQIYGYDTKYGQCLPKTTHPKVAVHNGIVFLVTFPVPLLVINGSIVVIIVSVKRHSKDLVTGTTRVQISSMPMSSKAGTATSTSSVSLAIEDNTTKMRLQRRQVRITKNMMVVVGVFFACIAPTAFGTVIPNTAPSLPYLTLIAYMNSCVNPIIYAKHPNFREVFLCILKGKWADIPEKTSLVDYVINLRY